MPWTEFSYQSHQHLEAQLTELLAELIAQAISERGEAWLALAGGLTPLPIYRALATRALDWSRVVVIPTDERCVPCSHPASNLRALHSAFAAASEITLLGLVDDSTPDTAVLAVQRLQQRSQRFDAVLLGMGADGHTASLFPGAAELPAGLDLAQPAPALILHPRPLPPEAPFSRITLSARRLLDTRSLLLAVRGDNKREVLNQAQAAATPLRLPISALLHAPGSDMHIHWSP